MLDTEATQARKRRQLVAKEIRESLEQNRTWRVAVTRAPL